MTGGGFGGNVLALVPADAVDDVPATIRQRASISGAADRHALVVRPERRRVRGRLRLGRPRRQHSPTAILTGCSRDDTLPETTCDEQVSALTSTVTP